MLGSACFEALHEWTDDMLLITDGRSMEGIDGAVGTSGVVCIEAVDELELIY